MKTLVQIFERHKTPHQEGGDKGTVHSYIPYYEKLLEPYRATRGNVLEIGVRHGSSMRMWQDYFPHADIHGIDIDPNCRQHATDRITIHIANSSKLEVINSLYGLQFQVIIDDGSHNILDQINTFNLVFPTLAPGGIYIIEDILHFERDQHLYKMLHNSLKVLDLRSIKGRGDDILLVYKK